MKRLLIIVAIVAMLTGCCSTGRIMGQPAIYQDGSHFWFSAYRYQEPTIQDAYNSASGEWWGCEVLVK